MNKFDGDFSFQALYMDNEDIIRIQNLEFLFMGHPD